MGEINLDEIRQHECPVCNCSSVKSEGRNDLHTSGRWNEHREFNCGYKLTFSPNYNRVSVSSRCMRDPEFKKLKEHRAAIVERITTMVSESEVDQDFKNRLLRCFDHIYIGSNLKG